MYMIALKTIRHTDYGVWRLVTINNYMPDFGFYLTSSLINTLINLLIYTHLSNKYGKPI